jgi:hypothetical protein
VTTDLLLDSVSGDRIFLDRLSVDGTLTVRSCHIDELVIDHAQADAVLVVNSRIGRLTIRNASMGCDVTVTDTALDFLALHSCGAVRLERLRVEELVQINALRGPVRISNTRLSALTVRSQVTGGRLGRPRVEVRGLRAREDITFDDLWLSALELDGVDTPELTLQRVRLDQPLRANELRCSETVRVNGLVIPAEDSTITNSTVRGPVDVHGLKTDDSGGTDADGATARLALHNTTVLSLTSSSETSSVISLHGSSVTGTLGLPAGASRYSLDDSSSIGDMELAGQVFRDGRQIVSFLERSFTEVSAVALESVRSALARRNRNREVDQLYYLARQREARLLPPFRRGITRGLLGGGARLGCAGPQPGPRTGRGCAADDGGAPPGGCVTRPWAGAGGRHSRGEVVRAGPGTVAERRHRDALGVEDRRMVRARCLVHGRGDAVHHAHRRHRHPQTGALMSWSSRMAE